MLDMIERQPSAWRKLADALLGAAREPLNGQIMDAPGFSAWVAGGLRRDTSQGLVVLLKPLSADVQAKLDAAREDPVMGFMFPVLDGDVVMIEAASKAASEKPTDATDLPLRYDEATVKACDEAVSAACAKFVYWPNVGWVNRRAPTEDFMKLDMSFNRMAKREFGVRYRKASDGKAAVWFPDTEKMLGWGRMVTRGWTLCLGLSFSPERRACFAGLRRLAGACSSTRGIRRAGGRSGRTSGWLCCSRSTFGISATVMRRLRDT